MGKGFYAVFILSALGITLILKGLTNNVMTTPSGEAIIPRWMYVFGGLVLLAFPVAYYLVKSEAVRDWLIR